MVLSRTTICCLSMLVTGSISPVNELNVVTGFFTNKWDPDGFSLLTKALEKSQKLKEKYDKINTINVCLGTGEKEEELRNGWVVTRTLKKSLEENLSIKNIVKKYKQKKPEMALVMSSVSAVIGRTVIQQYGQDLPFKPKQFISICAPQAGIYNVPPDGKYTNSVEQACSEVQKFTTDSIMADSGSSPDKPAKPGFWLSSAASFFGAVVGGANVASIARKALYNQTVSGNWISLWRDPYHLKEYQLNGSKDFPPYLPAFNQELAEIDAKKYEKELSLFKQNIKQVNFFDFITSDNDMFISPETALCQEKNQEKVIDGTVFLTRIGVDANNANFYTVKNAGHQCHTNKDIVKKTVECIENRW